MNQTIRTQIHTIGDFTFDNGEPLPGIQLAYETYGTLTADKSNAKIHAIHFFPMALPISLLLSFDIFRYYFYYIKPLSLRSRFV